MARGNQSQSCRFGNLVLVAMLCCSLVPTNAFDPAANRVVRKGLWHAPMSPSLLGPAPVLSRRPSSQLSKTRLQGVVAATLAQIPHPHVSTTSIAGKLKPFLRRFHFGASELSEIGSAIVAITDWQDVLLLVFLAFCTPAFSKYRNKVAKNQELRRFGLTRLASDVSKVALSVYVVDICMVVLSTIGFTFPRDWKVSAVFTKVAYSVWALREFMFFKRNLICTFYNVTGLEMGRLEILDRFINALAVFLYGLFLVDWLSLKLGFALKSIFGFASVFSVAFTLASKDIMSNLLAGIWLQASGKAVPGDAVKFGDSTSGGLIRMGWLETSLRDGEGAIVKIPNSGLAGQKISNLSEIQKSLVKQTLRFDYADADNIPKLIQEIKDEIMRTCKKLVVDGSRPFRVHFTNYMDNHLEVTVETHHNISPVSGEYHDNRQDLLLAINRAVKKCGMEFAQKAKGIKPNQETSARVVPAEAYLETLTPSPEGG
jgi:small-conductance mechanosensitive channel